MRIAPPTPTLNGIWTTWAPARIATSAVSSLEPSSTTRMCASGTARRTSSITAPIVAASFSAGMATSVRGMVELCHTRRAWGPKKGCRTTAGSRQPWASPRPATSASPGVAAAASAGRH